VPRSKFAGFWTVKEKPALIFKEGATMTSTVLIENLKAKIVDLPQDELEDEFELYKSLQARSVRDEIYQELLAQELDRREHEQEWA
jgi:hypothetical protein